MTTKSDNGVCLYLDNVRMLQAHFAGMIPDNGQSESYRAGFKRAQEQAQLALSQMWGAAVLLHNYTDQLDQAQALEERQTISQLTALLDKIDRAINDPGLNPTYHELQVQKLKANWPVLWQALEESVRGLHSVTLDG